MKTLPTADTRLVAALLALTLPLCAQGEGTGRENEAKQRPPAEPGVPKPDQEQRGDAAPAYRRLVALLREQCGERFERLPEIEDAAMVPSEREATSDVWRRATANAAPVFEQWRLAIAEPRCRFRATSSELHATEFMQDLFLGLQRFRCLVIARGLQAIADRDADAAVASVEALLAHAVHLQQEPDSIAWAVAAGAEKQAVDLHEAVARAFGDAAKERTRAAIRRHLERRGGIAAAGAALRIETFRLFDGMLAELQRGDDAKAKIAREFAADVRRSFTAQVDPLLAVLEKATGEWTPALRAELADRIQQLRAAAKARQRVLEQLQRDGKLLPDGIEPASDLGLLLATLLLVDPGQLVDELEQARERLAAAGS